MPEDPVSRPTWVLWAWLVFTAATGLAVADLFWLSARERAALAQAQAAAMQVHPSPPAAAVPTTPAAAPTTPAKPQP